MSLITKIKNLYQDEAKEKDICIPEKIIKENPKDFLKAFEMCGQWAKLAFKGLDDFYPLNTFLSSVKMGKDTLCIPELGTSLSELGLGVSNYKKDKKTDKNFLFKIRTSFLDSINNSSDIFKWLNNCKIVQFSSSFFKRVSVIGAFAFTASSFDKTLNKKTALLNFEKNKQSEKYNHYKKIAKNIGVLALIIIPCSVGTYFNKTSSVSLGLKSLISLPLIAGIATCLIPIKNIQNQRKKLKKFAFIKQKEKEYLFLKTAKTVGTLVIAILVTLKALAYFIAPTVCWTFLITMVVISNFYANFLEKKYELDKNKKALQG